MLTNRNRIMLVVVNELEAGLVKSVSDRLLSVGGCEVVIIGTGKYCCQRGGKLPECAMAESGMPYKSLDEYGTKNIAEILCIECPDVVVVGGDQEYLRRAFVCAGNSLGIPTVMFQLGIGSNVVRNSVIVVKRTAYQLRHYALNIACKYLYLLRTVVALRWTPWRILGMVLDDIRIAFTVDDSRGKYAQHILVAGHWERETLRKRGIDENKVMVVGRPTFQKLSEASHSFSFDGGSKVILLLTTAMVEHGWWSADRRAEFVRGIVDSISPILSDSVRLAIKLHPIESVEEYREILGDRQKDVSLFKDVPLADIVEASDVVVVGGYSTTVLEAGILQKPVVLLNVYDEPETIPYAKMGIAVEVNRLDLLRGVVAELLGNGMARVRLLKQSKEFFGTNREFVDGRAVERIADTLVRLAREHKEKG